MLKVDMKIDALIPMSDGTELTADIWLPESDGPVPVLLTRTPYGKHQLLSNYDLTNPLIWDMVEAGYAVVLQEARGTSRSNGGPFLPHVDDRDDGADTVKWLIEQDWCDGNVGSWGLSYGGLHQWATAASGVEGLKAMVPSFGPMDPYKGLWYTGGGALNYGLTISWYSAMALIQAMRSVQRGEGDPAELGALASVIPSVGMPVDQGSLYWRTPVADHPDIKKHMPFFAGLIDHPSRDEFWQKVSASDAIDKVTTPALTITGWYDRFCPYNIDDYMLARDKAATQEARDGQRLIIGPWAHDSKGFVGQWPDRQFGPAANLAAIGFTQTQIAFFDHHLKGKTDSLDGMAPVRIFVMGIDQWRDEQSWPLHDTKYVDYHLGGDGPANTIAGAGTLAPVPATADVTDTYLYDPRRPAPTIPGELAAQLAPADQTELQQRDDVLVFTTPVLEQAVEVTGEISIQLFVSSSAVDTDFVVQLTDVFPDGRPILLCEGLQRMRYRESLAAPKLMEPGEIYEVTIDVAATSNVFLPGHRIRIDVSSSNFPRYDRNGNTADPVSSVAEKDMVVAINNIHRGPSHPSRITLPIIER